MSGSPYLASAPQTRSLLDGFFGGAGACEVEARSTSGEAEPAAQRNASRSLMHARNVLLGAAIALSASPGFAHDGQPGYLAPPGEHAASEFSIHIPSATRHARTIAGQPKHAAGKDWVTITEQSHEGNGPSAHFQVNDDGKFTCEISMHTVDQVATRMLKDVSTESVLKFREYTLSHEASHCEFNAKMAAAQRYEEEAKIHGSEYGFKTAARFEYQLESMYGDLYKLREPMVRPTMSLISEGYADTRALLIMAATDITKAKSPIERQEALKEFDDFAAQIGSSRRDSSSKDPAHDSSRLVETIRKFVQDKASTPDGLKELQEMSKDYSRASSYAIQWSMADAMGRSHSTNIQSIVLALNDVETAADPSLLPRDLRQLAKHKDEVRARMYSGTGVGIRAEDFESGVKWMLLDFQKRYGEAQRLGRSPAPSEGASSPEQTTSRAPAAKTSQANTIDTAALSSRIFSSSFLGQRDQREVASIKRKGPGMG